MKPKIRTQYNASEMPRLGQTFSQPSKTIPDDTYSIREIIERYVRGIPFVGAGPAVYDEDQGGYFPDISRMDLADQQAFVEAELEAVQKRLDASKASEKAKAADLEFQRRLEEWKKENPPPPPTLA